jgi:hypothetical protein
MKTAVLVIGYCRPESLRRSLTSLLSCPDLQGFKLIVSLDGQKSSGPDVALTQNVVLELELPTGTDVILRPLNLGLKAHVKLAVEETLAVFDSVIVVEDDLDLHPDFLTHMARGLDQFREDPGVFSISGHLNPNFTTTRSWRSSPFFSSWGWATWRDRWSRIDWGYLEKPKLNAVQVSVLEVGGIRSNLRMLRLANQRKIDSWAIYVFTHCVANGLKSMYPAIPMVNNLGMDGLGTHADRTSKFDIEDLNWKQRKNPLGMDSPVSLERRSGPFKFYWSQASPFTRLVKSPRLLVLLPIYLLSRKTK